ncbi:hypothetical protein LG71_14855 [Pluralibacter gergoviae]|nr:hypothetical protein LG71_14855 [Pluralibacter gergoviae]
MDRIAEKAFAGILQQIREEECRRQLFELRVAGFKLAEYGVLLFAAEFGEKLAVLLFAPGVGIVNAEVVDLLRHQRQLVAHLFRHVGIKGALHVPD